MHSLCKLPYGETSLSFKRGKLSKDALAKHRSKWLNTIAAYIDEVSMISAEQFYQCDTRMRQAKESPLNKFGNLAMNICGDFLQLRPVKKRSLAVPLDAQGHCEVEDEDAEQDRTKATTQDKQAAEAREGFALWRSITRVVCVCVSL